MQKARAKLRDEHTSLLRSHLNALEDAEVKDFFGRCALSRSAVSRHRRCVCVTVWWCFGSIFPWFVRLCFLHRDRELRPDGADEDGAETAGTTAMGDDWDGDAEVLLTSGGGAGEGSGAAAVEAEGRGDFSPELFDEDEIGEDAEVLDEVGAPREPSNR